MTRHQENNLYILDLFNVSELVIALATINNKALKLRHTYFDHLREQKNMITLASMLQGMDLAKPPLKTPVIFLKPQFNFTRPS